MITLVVPIFNMSLYLEKFIHSILNQTDNRFEVILVDDGSTDNSGKICDLYSKQYSEIIRTIHKENGGLSSARNTGISAAKGKFICFPDPDDWLENDFVEKFIMYQEKYEADLICLGYYSVDNNVDIIVNENVSSRLMNQKDAMKSLIIAPKIKGFAWNKLYKLEIIRENNIRFEKDVGTTEDLDFTFRYLQFCSTIFHDPSTRIYHYLQRPGAATHSLFNERKIESIKTYEKMITSTDMPELKKAARAEICNTAINLMWEFVESNIANNSTEKQIKKYIRDNMNIYIWGNYYGGSRKIQCCMALVAPKIFYKIMKSISRRRA